MLATSPLEADIGLISKGCAAVPNPAVRQLKTCFIYHLSTSLEGSLGNSSLLSKFYSNLLLIAIGSVQGHIGSLIILALIFGGNANRMFNFLVLQFPHHKDGRDLPLIKHPERNQWEGSQMWIMGSLTGFFYKVF